VQLHSSHPERPNEIMFGFFPDLLHKSSHFCLSTGGHLYSQLHEGQPLMSSLKIGVPPLHSLVQSTMGHVVGVLGMHLHVLQSVSESRTFSDFSPGHCNSQSKVGHFGGMHLHSGQPVNGFACFSKAPPKHLISQKIGSQFVVVPVGVFVVVGVVVVGAEVVVFDGEAVVVLGLEVVVGTDVVWVLMVGVDVLV